MVDEQHGATAKGPARRSVVASAWAAPVILTAAAAPAASASTAGFDVALDPPQLGGGVTVYNGDFTRIYTVDEPIAWVVANHGGEVAPGGFPMSITCDNRIWNITSMEGGIDKKRANLPITQRVSKGHSTTVTFTIPDDIPPHTDSYSGFWVSVGAEFVAKYPHDGVSPVPTATRWEITPPAGDANPANNVVEYQSYKDEGPDDMWGTIATRVKQETVKWSDGTTLNRPTTVEMTSIGPHPTPDGSFVHLSTDARMSTDIRVTNVTVDGAASSILGAGKSSVWQTVSLAVNFPLSRPLVADEVLRFDISYVDDDSELPSQTYPGQTNLLPPDEDLNKPNRRANDRSYFENA